MGDGTKLAAYGLSSMVAPLRRVAVRQPDRALLTADLAKWNYGPGHDPGGILRDHAGFVDLLKDAGCEVLWIDGEGQDLADSVFTYDPSLMTPQGAILMNPGKALRQGEEDLHRRFYEDQGIPILGSITGAGSMDAGDSLWLDDKVLALGRGYRTNQAAIDQMTALLSPFGISVRAFDLPVYQGRAACLHIMSLVSLLDHRLALVCAPLMPVGLRLLMEELGYDLLEAPLEEFESSGTISLNILTTAPRQCLMVEGSPQTLALLESAGVSVRTFSGEALCVACEGGPTCLTRPLLRG
ncbi:dimethylarginine dimethylaminohydrolase family protein [Rhodovibrionaceae bacterium A322]